jgi:hypothetical protein
MSLLTLPAIFAVRNTARKRRAFGSLRLRLENIIKIDLRDKGLNGVAYIHLSPDRHQCLASISTVVNFWLQQETGNCLIK